MVPSRQKTDLPELFSSLPEDIKYIVLIFDQDGLSVGKKVMMDLSTHTDVMRILRQVASTRPDSLVNGGNVQV